MLRSAFILALTGVCCATALGAEHAAAFFDPWARVYADRRLWHPPPPETDALHQSLQWRARAMRDEHGNIDPDAVYRANVHRRTFLQGHSASRAVGTLLTPSSWVSRGPQNVGGRTRALLVHPTTPDLLYAGAVSGGVWKSTDHGVTWQPLTDFMTNIAVSTLAFDGSDSNTLYAGTGEMTYDAIQGAGVFKSTDAGLSWNRLQSTASWTYVSSLASIPGQSVLFAAATGGIYRSTNGGSSWGQGNAPVAPGGYGMRVVVDPNNAANVLAVNQNFNFSSGTWSYQILYSTNGGASFTPATHPAVNDFRSGIELAYAKSAANVVYAHVGLWNGTSSRGEVWRSTDGGHTFARVSAQGVTDCRTETCALWVDPSNLNFLVLGSTSLAKSTDGGATVTGLGWADILTGGLHADLHTIVARQGYDGTPPRTVYIGTDGGVFRTDDITTGGVTSANWSSLNNTYQTAQYYAVVGSNEGVGRLIGGTQDNGTLYTSLLNEPPRAATNAGLLFGGDGGYVARNHVDTNYVYGEYVYLQLFRSTDSGLSATFAATAWPPEAGNASTANFLSPFVLDPNHPTTMLAAGSAVWRSTNITAPVPTWDTTPVRPAGTTPINALAVAPGSSDIMWVAENNGTIARTMNATALSPSWTTVHLSGVTGELPNRLPTSIVIDPDDADTVYITYGGYVYDNIWRTTNGTAPTPSFQAVTSISSFGWPPAPVRALARHPRNRNALYAGTEVGVYESGDGGNTWSTSQDGPNDAPVYDLAFLRGTDLLLAGTYGRGLWTADTSSSVSTFAPTNLVATANGTATVDVSWTAYPGATSYQVLRKAGGATQWTITPVNGSPYTDTTVSPGVTYLYKVKAVVGSTITGASNVDLATTVTFTLDGQLAGNLIRAQHLTEIRAAVNLVLTAAGLPRLTFAETPTSGITVIRATDITALRTGLTRAYRNIGIPDPTFAEVIVPGMPVSASHFQEVRDRVK